MRLTIARALNAFGLLVVIGCLAIAGSASFSLQQLRIGGVAYEKIVAGKDLVADVLPPPLYVIEAFLEANVLAENPSSLDDIRKKFSELRKSFIERKSYWDSAGLPPTIKLELFASNREAERFWSVLNDRFIPAIAKQDAAAIKSSKAELSAAYATHRTAVDALVTDANAFLARAEADAREANVLWQTTMVGTAAGVLVMVVIGVLIIRSRVVGPILGMSRYMARLVTGTYDEQVPFGNRGDEVGEMARSVGVFRESAIERRDARLRDDDNRAAAEVARARQEAAQLEEDLKRQRVVEALASGLEHVARGDLVFRLKEPLAPEYDKLRMDFNAAMESLASTLRTISTATDSVYGGARDISSAADDLSRRTEQQAAALEETSAALNGIVDAVRMTSDMSNQAREAVNDAKTQAVESGVLVRDAILAMDTIEKSSRQIGDIIGLIDEIAFQTNLLALNAGVEAARAGDAGRGFAIVAQEVRGLAQRSTEAAKQIKALISTSNSQIDAGVGLVRGTGEAFTSIGAHVELVTTLVEKIATLAKEQAASLREVNVAVNQMDQTTQQNAAMVEETTTASHSLSEKALDLGGLVGQFKLNGGSTPAAAGGRHAPIESPARALGKRIAQAFGAKT
jgi:methyl-accepting chemotaxis protein